VLPLHQRPRRRYQGPSPLAAVVEDTTTVVEEAAAAVEESAGSEGALLYRIVHPYREVPQCQKLLAVAFEPSPG
jgi:hypothetical protein